MSYLEFLRFAVCTYSMYVITPTLLKRLIFKTKTLVHFYMALNSIKKITNVFNMSYHISVAGVMVS